MNDEQVAQLRRRMGEAAALPHDDPQRLDVVREIGRSRGPLEREWLELVREDERLRLELARVEPPAHLQQRLLAISREARSGQRWFRRASRWLYAAAAALVLAGFMTWGTLAYQSRARVARSLDQVATLTMACHESEPQLSIVTSDWQDIWSATHTAVHYPVDRPMLDPAFQLMGGKVMTLGGSKMIYTRWQKDGRVYSLHQLCGKEFGLPLGIPRQEVRPGSLSKARCRVIVWTENHCDYALVFAADSEQPTAEQLKGA